MPHDALYPRALSHNNSFPSSYITLSLSSAFVTVDLILPQQVLDLREYSALECQLPWWTNCDDFVTVHVIIAVSPWYTGVTRW